MSHQLVKYNGKNLLRIAGLRFMPGNNRLDSKVWEQAKEHPLVLHRLHTEVLEEVNPTEPVEEGEDPTASLKGFTEKAAIKKVTDTVDRDLLQLWLDAETRKPVKAALEKQLAAVQPPTGGSETDAE